MRLTERVQRPWIDPDIYLADRANRLGQRQVGHLGPVNFDRDHAAIVAVFVKRPDQALIIGARGGQHRIHILRVF